MKTIALVLFAVLVLIPGTPTQGSCGGDRQACYRTCVDCRTRCKDESCKQTCYQIKRSCCASNGFGGGPRKDCTCT